MSDERLEELYYKMADSWERGFTRGAWYGTIIGIAAGILVGVWLV